MTYQARMKRALTVAGALAFAAAVTPAHAAPQPTEAAVAGGIGAVEREHLSSNPPHGRNVKLVFSLDTGNYLADVHVKVTGIGGEVIVEGVARGPWVYATLPVGKYVVTATYAKHRLKREVAVVDDRSIVAYFRWPASAEESVPTSTGVVPILRTGAGGSVL